MIVPLTPIDFLRRAVHLYPEQTAVDEDCRFSYYEYSQRVNRLSNALVSFGVKPGQIVSSLTFNCHQLLEAYYGVIKIGAVLNPINIRMGKKELQYILRHSASKVIFTCVQFAPIVRDLKQQLPNLREVVFVDGEIEKGEIV